MLEKSSYRWIYVDPDNKVHVLVPVCSGQWIGLDNTCKSTLAFREFLREVIPSIRSYMNDLQGDIKTQEALKTPTQTTAAKERWEQLNTYYSLITAFFRTNAFNDYLYSLPAALKQLFNKTNLLSVRLSPAVIDRVLNYDPYFCSFERSTPRDLSQRLRRLNLESSSLESLVLREFEQQLNAQPQIGSSFLNIQVWLRDYIRTLMSIDHLDELFQNHLYIQEAFFKKSDLIDENSTPQEVLQVLLNAFTNTTDYQFAMTNPIKLLLNQARTKGSSSSLDSNLSIQNQLSVAIQLFIFFINAAAYEKSPRNKLNFGKIIEDNSALKTELLDQIQTAISSQNMIENAIISFFKTHIREFNENVAFSEEVFKSAQTYFCENYPLIKDSPHMDEFVFVLPGHMGQFFSHSNYIVTTFSYLLQSSLEQAPQNRALFEKFFSSAHSSYLNQAALRNHSFHSAPSLLAVVPLAPTTCGGYVAPNIVFPTPSQPAYSTSHQHVALTIPGEHIRAFNKFANPFRQNFLNVYFSFATQSIEKLKVGERLAQQIPTEIRNCQALNSEDYLKHMKKHLTITNNEQVNNNILLQLRMDASIGIPSDQTNPHSPQRPKHCYFLNWATPLDQLVMNTDYLRYMQVISGYSTWMSEHCRDVQSIWRLYDEQFSHEAPETEMIQWMIILNNLKYILDNYLDSNTYTVGFLDEHAESLMQQTLTKLKDVYPPNCFINAKHLKVITHVLYGVSLFGMRDTLAFTKSEQGKLSVTIQTDKPFLPHINHLRSQTVSSPALSTPLKKGYALTVSKDKRPGAQNNGDYFQQGTLQTNTPTHLVLEDCYRKLLNSMQGHQDRLAGMGSTYNGICYEQDKLYVSNLGDSSAYVVVHLSNHKFISLRLTDVHSIIHHRKRTQDTGAYYYDWNSACIRNDSGVNTCAISFMANRATAPLKPDMLTTTQTELLTLLNISPDNLVEMFVVQISDGIVVIPDFNVILKPTANGSGDKSVFEPVCLAGKSPASTDIFRPEQAIGRLSALFEAEYQRQAGLQEAPTFDALVHTMILKAEDRNELSSDDKTVVLNRWSHNPEPHFSVVFDTHHQSTIENIRRSRNAFFDLIDSVYEGVKKKPVSVSPTTQPTSSLVEPVPPTLGLGK